MYVSRLSCREAAGFLIRTAVVQTMLPGASPERMEQLITDKLEKKAQEMPEVDNITSGSHLTTRFSLAAIAARWHVAMA